MPHSDRAPILNTTGGGLSLDTMLTLRLSISFPWFLNLIQMYLEEAQLKYLSLSLASFSSHPQSSSAFVASLSSDGQVIGQRGWKKNKVLSFTHFLPFVSLELNVDVFLKTVPCICIWSVFKFYWFSVLDLSRTDFFSSIQLSILWSF